MEFHRPQQPRRAAIAGRSRGADRLGPARRQALRRADGPLWATNGARCHPAAHGLYRARPAPAHRRHSGRRISRRRFSRRRRQEPRRPAADQGLRPRQGRRHRSRSHRLVQAGGDCVQRAVRGLDQGRLFLRDPLTPARCGHLGREGPLEPGIVPAGEGDRAQGLDLQPDLSGGGRGALCADQPGDRSDLQGAGAGAAERHHRRQLRQPVVLLLCRHSPVRRLLGVPRGQ